MNIKGWIGLTFFGLIDLLFQMAMPDLIPDMVNNLLIRPDISSFTGLKPTLTAFLCLYLASGVVSFVLGIFGIFISYRRYSKKFP